MADLIVTVAGTSSDAYISLNTAEAIKWILDDSHRAAWDVAKKTCKEDAIRKATFELDSLLWDGIRSTDATYIADTTATSTNTNRDNTEFKTTTQALECPRDFMHDENGTYLIPPELEKATLVQAASYLVGDGILSIAKDAVAAGIKRFQIDQGVEMEFDGRNKTAASSRTIVSPAYSLIKKFIRRPRIDK